MVNGLSSGLGIVTGIGGTVLPGAIIVLIVVGIGATGTGVLDASYLRRSPTPDRKNLSRLPFSSSWAPRATGTGGNNCGVPDVSPVAAYSVWPASLNPDLFTEPFHRLVKCRLRRRGVVLVGD